MMPWSTGGIIIAGRVHVQKNMISNNKPAKPAVIMVALVFFLASKDADIAWALFIQIYVLINTGAKHSSSHLCINDAKLVQLA